MVMGETNLEAQRAADMALGRARASQARRGLSYSDDATEDAATQYGSAAEMALDGPDCADGASGSSRRAGGRLDRFFEKIKEHIIDSLSLVCSKIDVVENNAIARDAAMSANLSQLSARITENEASGVAGTEATLNYFLQLQAENRQYHDGLMQYLGNMHGT